jgi:hypothetical protein
MSHICTLIKMRKQKKVVNNHRFSGQKKCQLQKSHRWSAYWTKELVRGPGERNILNTWSSGRAIQLKMPTGRMKPKYRSMDKPCERSWTGAHENFQAREYDAGASPAGRKHAWMWRTAGQAPAHVLLKCFEV